MNKISNRLFSSFLSNQDLAKVKLVSYFPLLVDEDKYSLLPSDHCYYYPLTVDVKQKKVIKGELNFFNQIIFNNYKKDNLLPLDKVNFPDLKQVDKQNAIIVNLIDNCYGHSFLKLLNLYEIYSLYKDVFDIFVICPIALQYFVPNDKFKLINVKLSFIEAMNCYDFEPIILWVKQQYKSIDFVTLDTYYCHQTPDDLTAFFGFLPENHISQKQYITFYYRADYFRTWAGNKQQKRIINFFNQLQNYFPTTQLVIAGDLDSTKFPNSIKDIRTKAFGKEVDLMCNSYFANSFIVIGLIGSNMLQPSMFCDFTVHLTQKNKITIIAEEMLNHPIESMSGWFKNIYLIGNEDLSDINSNLLCEQIILLYHTYIAKKYKEVAFTNKLFSSRMSQSEFYKNHYPFFDSEKSLQLKSNITDFCFKKSIIKYKINKVLKKLKLNY